MRARFEIVVGVGALLSAQAMAVNAQQPQSSRVTFESLTFEDGLSDERVFEIFQDSRGFLWFGTRNGLNRFDGYNIRTYHHDPGNPRSLSHNGIDALFEDASGTFWIGTEGGGLNRFDPTTEGFTRFMHDPDDPRSLSSNEVLWLYEDVSTGAFWVGTNGGGINRLDRDSGLFTRFTHDPADSETISDNHVLSFLVDGSGAIWFTTLAGLNRFDRERERFTRFLNDPFDPRSLSHNDVRRVLEDHEGVLLGGDGWRSEPVPSRDGGFHSLPARPERPQ